jgi:hypothetical protein
MHQILPAEIMGTPFEVLRPDAAEHLGRLLTPIALENFGHITWLASFLESGAPQTRGNLGNTALQHLEQVTNCLRYSLLSSGLAFEHVQQQLVSGLNQRHIAWHVDSSGDVRFLLNIGEEPTYVDVATDWDPAMYLSGELTYNPPVAFERLELLPGQGYVANNIVNTDEPMRPHETPYDENRLVLRTSLYCTSARSEEAYTRAAEEGILLRSPEYCRPQQPLVVSAPMASAGS